MFGETSHPDTATNDHFIDKLCTCQDNVHISHINIDNTVFISYNTLTVTTLKDPNGHKQTMNDFKR